MIPCSPAEIIEGTKNSRNRPSLDDRFNLARVSTSCLLEFHKVDRMHKSISAYNILSLTTSDPPTKDWLKDPYIVGFNCSRPDQPLAFTEGPRHRSQVPELPARTIRREQIPIPRRLRLLQS